MTPPDEETLAREYRVTWKRRGLLPKRKRYATLAAARRFLRLFGPEPWTVFALGRGGVPKDGDALACCRGTEEEQCNCGGRTLRQQAEHDRKQMPPLEWVRLQSRPVGAWEAADAPEIAAALEAAKEHASIYQPEEPEPQEYFGEPPF